MSKIYSKKQLTSLIVLRVLIGWHFLYEGLLKVTNPDWSAIGYLADSHGFLSGIFIWIANTPAVLDTVNFLNEWGLVLIGLGLILGVFTQIACISGIALLFFYYLSHPPFPFLEYFTPTEGNYLIVDKTLIETVSLFVLLVFPTGHIIGIDRILFKKSQIEHNKI
ncbi:MAG: DoxX family membrane protein [Bacteroidales bacterium]|nr:DoxX family membrane protein [Bacteroidales bacterium]